MSGPKAIASLKAVIKKTFPEVVENVQLLRYSIKLLLCERNRAKNGEHIKIVFLVTRTNIWPSVQSVYEAAKRNAMVDTYVVALPPLINSDFDMATDKVYDFCKEFDENTIRAYDREGRLLFDVESIKPDFIFLSIPYDDEYPEHYKAHELVRSASLCYVPYGYILVKSNIQKVTTDPHIVWHVKYIFADGKITFDAFKRKMKFSEKITGKRLYNDGFPRFDLYSRKNAEEDISVNTLMWLPRWTTDINGEEEKEASSFLKFKDAIVEYAEREATNLIIRPHPLTFGNYIRLGVMTEAEVAEYKARITLSKQIILDESPSYYEGLLKADVLIADYSSIVAEYFITGKPIIYLGSNEHYTPEHMEMYNSFYHAESWDDVEKVLTALKNGVDPKKEQRQSAITHFLADKPKDVGEHIVDILINDHSSRK